MYNLPTVIFALPLLPGPNSMIRCDLREPIFLTAGLAALSKSR